MRVHINLLPWRQQQHSARLKRLCIRLAFTIGIALALCFPLDYAAMQLRDDIAQQQAKRQKTETELNQITQQINRLRQHSERHSASQPIDNEMLLQFMTLLNDLPFSQGELQSLEAEEQGISMKGTAQTQAEFERVHQFLTRSELFRAVKLNRFAPQREEFYFEFQIDINNNKDAQQ
ncbi:PilN domain-containing protein [Caviibacterium pharyngocola]|uniref:Competence protein ComB n=1 Tax=Caviibacterium pharyngocola TaxID=28159 RepID=A0A2M8RVQ4_9PAST|nr:hypothetical protein [Caviibacterium pharyngocola]PJG82961.1 hypothetical protein CVP04_06255 [Caviibacterium pharyngocola]